MAVKWSCTACF